MKEIRSIIILLISCSLIFLSQAISFSEPTHPDDFIFIADALAEEAKYNEAKEAYNEAYIILQGELKKEENKENIIKLRRKLRELQILKRRMTTKECVKIRKEEIARKRALAKKEKELYARKSAKVFKKWKWWGKKPKKPKKQSKQIPPKKVPPQKVTPQKENLYEKKLKKAEKILEKEEIKLSKIQRKRKEKAIQKAALYKTALSEYAIKNKNSDANITKRAEEKIKEADNYFNKEMYKEATELYERAYLIIKERIYY